MTTKAVLVGVLAIGLAATPALARKHKPAKPAVPDCVKGKVLESLEMRMLQTELVVGALSCQMTPRYNDFVTAYKKDLMTAHRTLLHFFRRESKMEDYKSKTANEVSQRSLANINEFCSYTSALYDKLLAPEKVQLASFVATEPSASRHGFEVCGQPASVVTAANGGKEVPMPRFKPDVAAMAAPTRHGKHHKADPNAAYVPPAASEAAPAAAAAAPTGTP
ncbi:MAG: hypothetical protein GC190_19705 [Alphaproteobacteria bacterium]|nr:hypothetical protein [Alphaproteobacteria bacterium]